MTILLILILMLLAAVVALAAGESLPRSVIGGGGGFIEADGLALRSAVGQPLTGRTWRGLCLCSGYLCGPGCEVWPVYLPAISSE